MTADPTNYPPATLLFLADEGGGGVGFLADGGGGEVCFFAQGVGAAARSGEFCGSELVVTTSPVPSLSCAAFAIHFFVLHSKTASSLDAG